jgi:hypothetical protein
MNPVSISRRDLHNTPPFFLPGRGLLCPQRRTTSVNAQGGSSRGLHASHNLPGQHNREE